MWRIFSPDSASAPETQEKRIAQGPVLPGTPTTHIFVLWLRWARIIRLQTGRLGNTSSFESNSQHDHNDTDSDALSNSGSDTNTNPDSRSNADPRPNADSRPNPDSDTHRSTSK